MHNLSDKKAQIFILTSVVIIGFFFTLSKYINPISFVDTSRSASSEEVFFLDNVKNKAIKTVSISTPSELEDNLEKYKKFTENLAGGKGFKLSFNYFVKNNTVDFNITVTSQRYILKSSFSAVRP